MTFAKIPSKALIVFDGWWTTDVNSFIFYVCLFYCFCFDFGFQNTKYYKVEYLSMCVCVWRARETGKFSSMTMLAFLWIAYFFPHHIDISCYCWPVARSNAMGTKIKSLDFDCDFSVFISFDFDPSERWNTTRTANQSNDWAVCFLFSIAIA